MLILTLLVVLKHVKVKTFKYKDDKYKTNDNYGFIAQEFTKAST